MRLPLSAVALAAAAAVVSMTPAAPAAASPARISAAATAPAEVICRYTFDRTTPVYWESSGSARVGEIDRGDFRNARQAPENGRRRIVGSLYGGFWFDTGYGRQVGNCWT